MSSFNFALHLFQMGPVFTLYIAGNRMTYLTEEEDYNKYFMQSEHVDFQKAVFLFVAKAGKFFTLTITCS